MVFMTLMTILFVLLQHGRLRGGEVTKITWKLLLVLLFLFTLLTALFLLHIAVVYQAVVANFLMLLQVGFSCVNHVTLVTRMLDFKMHCLFMVLREKCCQMVIPQGYISYILRMCLLLILPLIQLAIFLFAIYY